LNIFGIAFLLLKVFRRWYFAALSEGRTRFVLVPNHVDAQAHLPEAMRKYNDSSTRALQVWSTLTTLANTAALERQQQRTKISQRGIWNSNPAFILRD